MSRTEKAKVIVAILLLAWCAFMAGHVLAGAPSEIVIRHGDKTLIYPTELSVAGFDLQGGETYRVVKVDANTYRLERTRCCPCPEAPLPAGVTE